jgi:nucleotide-binding universal stress UspA family protein
MFERVLTATDMLGACDSAVVTALEIAQKEQGRLFVLHVLEPSYFHECGPLESIKDFKTGEETTATQEYKERVIQELDNKCGGALKPYGNYQIDISYGRPGIEIRRWARKIGADLIVLGPHAGKIEEEQELIGASIGDTVEDVIMYSTYPTMIVNRLIPKERLHFKKIMVCIDFSKSCGYAVEFAVKLARKYDSKLLLFYMLSTSQSGKNESEVDIVSFNEKLRDFCKIPEEIKNEYSIWKGSRPYLEILKYSYEKDVDLIVMGSHTPEDDKRWYVGSTVEEVTAECLCPVVVVTHPEIFPKIKK